MPFPFSSPPLSTISESSPSGVGCSHERLIHARKSHNFRPPDVGATRSPCPALNALANHSYLPPDGHNVTFTTLLNSLQAGFGLSLGLALFLTVGTFILLRRPTFEPFNLHHCARHNFIEHNASMVHDDTPLGGKYAPTEVNHTLLDNFLAKAHPSETGEEMITTEEIAEGRIERESACAPIDPLHAEIARGEFAMVMEIFGKGSDRHLARHEMKMFLGENRFPVGWEPKRTPGLWAVVARTRNIKLSMGKMRKM